MTVEEYLDFMYDLKKVKLPRNAHIKEICDMVKITDVYHRMIRNLSKGYRQRAVSYTHLDVYKRQNDIR